MFIPYRQIAKDLRNFENALSGLYIDQQKGPRFIESCEREIARAEKEETGEVKDNIIKAHQKQIEETKRDLKNGREMIANMLLMRQDIIKQYFTGFKSLIYFFTR